LIGVSLLRYTNLFFWSKKDEIVGAFGQLSFFDKLGCEIIVKPQFIKESQYYDFVIYPKIFGEKFVWERWQVHSKEISIAGRTSLQAGKFYPSDVVVRARPEDKVWHKS